MGCSSSKASDIVEPRAAISKKTECNTHTLLTSRTKSIAKAFVVDEDDLCVSEGNRVGPVWVDPGVELVAEETSAALSSSEDGIFEERLPDGSFLTPEDHVSEGHLPESLVSVYGRPVSPQRAADLLPPGGGGLVWHAQLVSDDWYDPEHCEADGSIKPRRPILPVRASDFFASLVQTADGRWIFSGVLNGWPGLTCLELCSITCKRTPKENATRFWDANAGPNGVQPSYPAGQASVRATLRMAHWSARGWTKDSPGNVWWSFAQSSQGQSLAHGDDMIKKVRADQLRSMSLEMPKAVRAHLFAHRYALGKGRRESQKDKITYHTAILLEWDHGRYTTVVELATLNGIGGRRGKSNWYHDKLEDVTTLCRAMPSQMVLPWKGEFAEIRCADVPARSLDEFKQYVAQYTGPELRFLDPHFQHSGPVRLHHCAQEDIMRYLLNYMARDRRYTQEFRNCQTFAADFYGFIAGKKDVVPFHPVMRVGYKRRSHLFLYQPSMYEAPNGSEGLGGGEKMPASQ